MGSAIKDLGECVIKQLQDEYNKETCLLTDHLKDIPDIGAYLTKLDAAISDSLDEVRKLFEVTYNEDEEHLLTSYLNMVQKKFDDITVENKCNPVLKVRNGIVWNIDIILKNCIGNVEKHAKIPFKEAMFKLSVRKTEKNELILVFENIISSDINTKELLEKINSINQFIQDKKYINMNTEDKHGMGYYGIALFLHNNLNSTWQLSLSLNKNVFSVNVFLGLEKKR